jgi:hypothetical protein
MNGRAVELLKSLYMFLLRCAAILVPYRYRSTWLREWTSELWYVYHSCMSDAGPSWQGALEVIAFCLGAFSDAFWLRRTTPWAELRRAQPLRSATQCAVFLAALTAASYAIALLLPSAHAGLKQSRDTDANHLVLISTDGQADGSTPTIGTDQYLLWKDRGHRLFSDLAFYQPIRKRIHLSFDKTPELSIARSSSNLFQLLGITIRSPSGKTPDNDLPQLVLSDRTWHTYFANDPHIFGQVIKVGLRKATIVGVIPTSSWRLRGAQDAWLLEPDRFSDFSADANGFVVGRVSNSPAYAHLKARWHLTIPWENSNSNDYECVALSAQSYAPFSIFVFTVLLALISLPATTSLPLGEYPARREAHGHLTKLRRWTFLCTKAALILPLVYFVSIDLAYCSPFLSVSSSQYIQLVSSFSICLFAFRWMLRDQRKRCPVCLRLLTNPARVGQPSRNFLAFNGTELICAGGHGLMHVPELPSSWFGSQRWLHLDSSWGGLFVESYLSTDGAL